MEVRGERRIGLRDFAVRVELSTTLTRWRELRPGGAGVNEALYALCVKNKPWAPYITFFNTYLLCTHNRRKESFQSLH